jgi:hypothetical protein
MSGKRWRHRIKNTVALFSDVSYTVTVHHGGDVCVLLAGHCSWVPPLPTRSHRCGSMTGHHNPHVCNCNWGGGRGEGVEWNNKLPSVFKVSQLSQKCSNCYIWAHSVVLTEIPLHWYKNYQRILINVHTGTFSNTLSPMYVVPLCIASSFEVEQVLSQRVYAPYRPR